MQKSIRVYELAKELGVKSKEILTILQRDMDIDVKNHMSSVNDQVASKVRALISGVTQETVEAKSTELKAPEREGVEETATPARGAPAQPPAAQRAEADDLRSSQQAVTAASPAPAPAKPRERTRQTAQKEIEISEGITVAELAKAAGLRPADAVRRLVARGIMAAINQTLSEEQAANAVTAMGFAPRSAEPTARDEHLAGIIEESKPEREAPRAPVVTVLGHVDHGKTTLLDYIRNTRVQAGEAGGITQHIGASTVKVGDGSIVFLDTPGHEAFTAMRARGASVTDVSVLVVACDDGVMPQTVEALNHAREAGVPVVVALNKIDVEGANADRVKQQLADLGLLPEEWGGDTVMVAVSAITGEGVDELLEMLSLVSEMQDLKADPDKRAHGAVIDARLDRGRGPVVTVLVQEGTLRIGDPVLAGVHSGRVRAMMDGSGQPLTEAGPSTPVELLGLAGVPEAGEGFAVARDEKSARSSAQDLQARRRTEEILVSRPVTLNEFYDRLKEEDHQELRLILKADVHGSLEALRDSLEKLVSDEVSVRVIHGGVGAISESDVMLAAASEAIIIGFNVVPDANARRTREREGVDVRSYRVIYEIIDDVKAAMGGLLKPEIRDETIGRAEVRATFRVPELGVIAGCYVTEGKVQRNGRVRVLRDGVVLFEGQISSLKRFKDDAREVASGYECGLGVANWQDIEEGDELEIYVRREVPRQPAL